MVKTDTIVNRLFLVYTILLPAFSRLLDTLDKSGRLPLALLLIGLLTSFNNKKFRGIFVSKPVVFWLLWSLFSLVNWFVIGKSPANNMLVWVFVLRHFVYPLMTMILVYYEGSKNLYTTTKWLIISYSVYLIMGLTMQSAGSGDGVGWDARGGALLGNSLPLNACALAFLVCFAYLKKWINYKVLGCLLFLCTAAILFTATRKAFGALGIMLLFLCLAKFNMRKPSNVIKFIFIVALIYLGAEYILSNSMMGNRMAAISEQSENINVSNNVFLRFVGDRAIQYIMAWDVFIKNPIMGIGIKNFPSYANFPFPLHTEYMVQLAEGGIVGSVLYICFIYGLLKLCFSTIKKKSFSMGLICLSGVLYILFINFTSWTFESTRYWVVYGIILAYCRPLFENKISGKSKYIYVDSRAY